jgi:hypothetical protein
VLVDTTRFERGWNWIGTVLHWIYFTPLRSGGDSDTWRWIVMGLSFRHCWQPAAGCGWD